MSTIKSKEKAGTNESRFRPIMLVSIFRYARGGMVEAAIAEALKISLAGWKKWKKKYPEIEEALNMGRTETKDGGNWHKFIYDRLSPDLRELWDRINAYDKIPNGVSKIETLLDNHGKLVRQQLFLFALVCFNFSKSKAMSKVCIDKDTLDYWIKNDERFCRLVEEIEWHKGNFYEESLVQLIKEGDTAATIFANKEFNSTRGYKASQRIDVNHSGQINHNVLDLDDLNLSISCKMEILNAMRAREERIDFEKRKPMMEAEYCVLGDISDEISMQAIEVKEE